MFGVVDVKLRRDDRVVEGIGFGFIRLAKML
jgi:hypothetical protein